MADSTHGDESDNSQSGSGSDSGDSKQFMTTEQFNRAFTARTKAFEKQVESKFDTFLEALKAKTSAAPKTGDSSEDGETGGEDDGTANAFKAMKSRLTKMERTIKDQNTQLAQRDNQVASEKMRRASIDELSKHGIQGIRATHALGHLVDTTKKVRLGEDGTPVFFNGEYEQPLGEGLEEWAASDEAALYQPPKGDGGSGERGGGMRIPQGDDPRSAAIRAIQQIL